MNQTLGSRLKQELDQFREDGVYKRLNHLDSAQSSTVRMEGRGMESSSGATWYTAGFATYSGIQRTQGPMLMVAMRTKKCYRRMARLGRGLSRSLWKSGRS